MRARGSNAVVHRESAKQCEQDENERRHWRQRTSGKEGHTWLISQRREVIDAGQAHHFPPRVCVVTFSGVWTFDFFAVPFQQPQLEATAGSKGFVGNDYQSWMLNDGTTWRLTKARKGDLAKGRVVTI